jgi:membrane protein
MLHASALTYYTIMATVPLLALFVFITRWLGAGSLYDRLLPHLAENREIFLQFFTFANAIIEQAKRGVIAAMGSAILFLSVTQLLSNLESSLNLIWKVGTSRSWLRIFADSLIFVLVVLCFYLSLLFLAGKAKFVAELVPYFLSWFVFTFIYLFMPNQKIPFSSGLIGGIVGGTIYLFFQWTYIYFQVVFLQLGAVYGSFAAVPLFLIWVQLSWCILLFGAEVSFAHAQQTD